MDKGKSQNELLVEQAYEKLILQIKSYRPTASLDRVEEAFKFAKNAHINQFRHSGEPYILHPLEVARILAEIKVDFESIIASLLHDVVEDTDVTIGEIRTLFGPDVALLVGGVTKIETVKYKSKDEARAETYRKMFFYMSEDVRVLLIKIADRLHNMRTLGAMPEEKQKKTSQETLDIYAPLAHRLGVAKLRYDLEDLAFKYSSPTLYDNLAAQVGLKVSDRIEIIEQIIKEIEAALEQQGIKATVEGRTKRLYSVHKKMISKDRTLDEIHDLYAVRVLVDDIAGCYAALGCVNGMYPLVPGRIKDYVAGKKPNGYQSLHTTLIGPGEPFEVQIRTFAMHDVAEFGIAAHWKYKESGKAAKDQWLQGIMDLQNEISDNNEFLQALNIDLSAFQSHMTCFTPEAEPKNLVRGACPIDFAYAVHSAVGDTMIGARVNGKLVPINHELQAGDMVEIVRSKNSNGPSKDWLNYVKSQQARTKINQWFNRENRVDNLQRGKEILEQGAIDLNVPLETLLANGREAEILDRFNCKTLEQLYVSIGNGGVKERQVINHLYREYEKTLPPPSHEELIENLIDTTVSTKHQRGILIKGLGDTAAIFSKCCNPVTGDEIVGFTTRGRGLTVHRTDCTNIINMSALDRRRIIPAHWGEQSKEGVRYLATLRIVCTDSDKLLYAINDVLKDENITVKSLKADVVQGKAIFILSIEIHNVEHLGHIITRLQNATGAYEIKRVNS